MLHVEHPRPLAGRSGAVITTTSPSTSLLRAISRDILLEEVRDRFAKAAAAAAPAALMREELVILLVLPPLTARASEPRGAEDHSPSAPSRTGSWVWTGVERGVQPGSPSGAGRAGRAGRASRARRKQQQRNINKSNTAYVEISLDTHQPMGVHQGPWRIHSVTTRNGTWGVGSVCFMVIGVFLIAVFLIAVFLITVFLIAVFLIAVFLIAVFLITVFLIAVFLIAVFLITVFLITVFLEGDRELKRLCRGTTAYACLSLYLSLKLKEVSYFLFTNNLAFIPLTQRACGAQRA
ncbi:hypothetical protein QBC46DRAFT_448402 [Diplogelasinospora grovesii]|uniref:Uncharacterized protein n=1 Tax=Diplogelasinospora grovesii TaxID=303347 RepID=A0AAN6S618_9PEZI|nr:hypothetical protein QBC46DRAFT_448402 [Diplogelasinospora grovesii]